MYRRESCDFPYNLLFNHEHDINPEETSLFQVTTAETQQQRRSSVFVADRG